MESLSLVISPLPTLILSPQPKYPKLCKVEGWDTISFPFQQDDLESSSKKGYDEGFTT